jgi:hypothetical protein
METIFDAKELRHSGYLDKLKVQLFLAMQKTYMK